MTPYMVMQAMMNYSQKQETINYTAAPAETFFMMALEKIIYQAAVVMISI